MAIGPGKYDPEAMAALLDTRATGVVLMVIGGDRGGGFSVVTTDERLTQALPTLLRNMADDIEADLS